MTPEKQRIAIAEVCGFHFIRGCFYTDPKVPIMAANVPDYPNDLNAMHEAEKTLTNDEWDDKFYHWLGFVVSGGQEEQLWQWRKMIVHATAAQRAEAFLRTIGKWEDG